MSIRDDLERALRRSWNQAELEVYADVLLSEGDPRGELVALDLHPVGDPPWRARREQLVAAWLGPHAALGKRVQHGVVHEMRAPVDVPLLATPLGDVVRGFTCWAWGTTPTAELVAALTELARRPRPWLSRLVIDYPDELPLAPALRDALVEATPNLVELYALHQCPFETFQHPSLERMYVFPALQRPVTETSATVIEIADPGWSGEVVVDAEAIGTLLEAVELAPDCNELYAVFGDLVGPHDSLPAALVRMHEAGLVALDGPLVRLTSVGRAVVRPPALRARAAPSRLPPNVVGDRKWVLWIGPDVIGLTWMLSELVVEAMQRLPLEDGTCETLRGFLAFLADVIDAGEWTEVRYPDDRDALLAALGELRAFRKLVSWQVATYAAFGDTGAWRMLDDAVAALAHHTSFRVAWGF